VGVVYPAQARAQPSRYSGFTTFRGWVRVAGVPPAAPLLSPPAAHGVYPSTSPAPARCHSPAQPGFNQGSPGCSVARRYQLSTSRWLVSTIHLNCLVRGHLP
jgi:hypothetical protein